RMFAGEGIETVLSVYTALIRAGRDISDTAFRSAIDLGSLGGRATGRICLSVNPRRYCPDAEPDLESPAMPVPDSVTELILLGDGDSEPTTTRCALERAAKRHAREGRNVRIAM